MFENAGAKIKTFAKVWFFIQLLAALVGAILLAESQDIGIGILLIMGGGFLVAWISSLFIYGFGEIVDTAIWQRKVRKGTPAPNTVVQPRAVVSVQPNVVTTTPPVQPANEMQDNQVAEDGSYWVCGSCQTKNMSNRTDCWMCGHPR